MLMVTQHCEHNAAELHTSTQPGEMAQSLKVRFTTNQGNQTKPRQWQTLICAHTHTRAHTLCED